MNNRKPLDTRNLILCAMFTALIAAGAFIKVPIPVVPFTLQFLFTNLSGLLLGRRRGLLATSVYILIGLLGLPVFASGGGIGYIFQPTFGYLIGFSLGAWLAGFIVERGKSMGTKTLLLASFANLTVVYGIGMIYYYLMANFYLGTPIGVKTLVLYCFILAVPGDIALCLCSTALAKRLYPIISKGEIRKCLNN